MLRLAIIGDLHFHLVREEHQDWLQARDLFYEEFLKIVLSIECDGYISVGDLVHEGIIEEYEEVYRHILGKEAPFLQVLGNHDVLGCTKRQVLDFLDQPAYQSVKFKDAHLIFLDTAREIRPDDWGGMLDEVQLMWLEKQIELSGEKPVLVFAHHPVHNTTTFSELEKMSVDPVIDLWNILNKKRGIGLYFNGHNHTHSIVQREQWHFVQTAAVLCHPSFRLVEIDQDYIRLTTLATRNQTIMNSRQILHRYLPNFPGVSDVKTNDLYLTIRFTSIRS